MSSGWHKLRQVGLIRSNTKRCLAAGGEEFPDRLGRFCFGHLRRRREFSTHAGNSCVVSAPCHSSTCYTSQAAASADQRRLRPRMLFVRCTTQPLDRTTTLWNFGPLLVRLPSSDRQDCASAPGLDAGPLPRAESRATRRVLPRPLRCLPPHQHILFPERDSITYLLLPAWGCGLDRPRIPRRHVQPLPNVGQANRGRAPLRHRPCPDHARTGTASPA